MDKAAGKVSTVAIPAGGVSKIEKLDVAVRACKQSDPFQPDNMWLFAEISKSPDGLIFSGWMSRNDPGDNPLQDADYDLWLVKCE